MQPQPTAFDAIAEPIGAALAAVAEQSFYSTAERCDQRALEGSAAVWIMSTVSFSDGALEGTLACWMPADLARRLFDAFTGRDPAAPAPRSPEIDDLVAEFSNMICGDWLSRFANQELFQLRQPVVARTARPSASVARRQWFKVHDRPIALDWELHPAGGRA